VALICKVQSYRLLYFLEVKKEATDRFASTATAEETGIATHSNNKKLKEKVKDKI
jgi:hypothetical protein